MILDFWNCREQKNEESLTLKRQTQLNNASTVGSVRGTLNLSEGRAGDLTLTAANRDKNRSNVVGNHQKQNSCPGHGISNDINCFSTPHTGGAVTVAAGCRPGLQGPLNGLNLGLGSEFSGVATG